VSLPDWADAGQPITPFGVDTGQRRGWRAAVAAALLAVAAAIAVAGAGWDVVAAAIAWVWARTGAMDFVLLGLVAVVGAELLARVVSGMPLFAPFNFVTKSFDLIEMYGYLRHDDRLGWCFKDDLNVSGGLTTGVHGLRMNDGTRRNPPLGAILAVGDSFTVGAVKDNETWPAYLEQLVGTPVINAGCGGYGVDQIVMRAEELVPILKPRTLIVGILAQDILRCNQRLFGASFKPWFSVKDMQLTLEGVPVPRITPQTVTLNVWQRTFGYSCAVHWLMTRLKVKSWTLQGLDQRYKIREDIEGIIVASLLLKRLFDITVPLGIRVIVAMLWGANEAVADSEWGIVPPVANIARTLGFEVIDFYEPLHAMFVRDPKRFGSLWLIEDGQVGHPSKEGNALIATHLHQAFFRNQAAPT